MLTTKNWRTLLVRPAQAFFLAAVLVGCTPRGARALLKGEGLLRQGKYAQAIPRLQLATQLLPANAQAWNHLGLAYHHAGQFSAAHQAYEQARRCDPNLGSIHYNLGCLFLDDNQSQAAVTELTAYTVLQPDSVDGWLKLGGAQVRTRQWDGAERSFQTVLRLQPTLPEGWNGLGIVQTQRKRPKEALTCFNNARLKHPNYGPALLNLAILEQYHLNNRAQALQSYEEYLDLKPTPPDAYAVQEVVRQLRAELAPPIRREATNVVVMAPTLAPTSTTNVSLAPHALATAPPAHPPGNLLATATPSAPTTNRPKSIVTDLEANTEPSTTVKPKPVEVARRTNSPPRMEESQSTAAAKPATNVTSPPPVIVPARVVELAEEPPPKLAQDGATGTPNPPPQAASSAQVEQARMLLARKSDDVPEETAVVPKRHVLDRLNPTTWFRGKRRNSTTPTPPGATADTRTDAGLESGSATGRRLEEVTPAVSVRMPEKHYVYQSPLKPARGDRAAAERVFAQAVQAHRDGRLSEAVDEYRQATKLDPSFYEAHYNLGLAAFELKEDTLSLSAYEAALSLNPTSANGRYNFALALEQGGYFQDAANELEKLLGQHPDEIRAHFFLASLYADRLSRPDLARTHYRRVLELAPQHPQAAAIRYWLAANP
jgi:tetratricopeptide (TPR) repeat protein